MSVARLGLNEQTCAPIKLHISGGTLEVFGETGVWFAIFLLPMMIGSPDDGQVIKIVSQKFLVGDVP